MIRWSSSVSPTELRVWGCRGGRSALGSRIGNLTSCYSVRVGDDVYVFDAGRGLVALADAVLGGEDAALRDVRRVHVLVTHAHMDHWEGLKDAAWMWRPRNGIAVAVYAPAEALAMIRRAHEPPSFVALDVLAKGTLESFEMYELEVGEVRELPGATVAARPLHHYSGVAPTRHYLHTLAYQLAIAGGPRVAYACDHEPTAETHTVEHELFSTSDLVLVDANYGELGEHAFGHGSLAYAAGAAARYPRTTIVATHHGPGRTDDAIEDGLSRHGVGRANFAIARDGARFPL